jgi:hypothetical protein
MRGCTGRIIVYVLRAWLCTDGALAEHCLRFMAGARSDSFLVKNI